MLQKYISTILIRYIYKEGINMLTKEQQTLVEDNLRLIGHFCKLYNYTYEEVYDVLAITLCKCASKYNPEQSAAFSTYVFRSFRNTMIQHKRAEKALSRNPENEILSLDYENINSNNGDMFTLKDIIPDGDANINMSSRMYWNDFWKWAEKNYTKRECETLRYLVLGYRPCVIAQKLGVTKQAVNCYMKGLRAKVAKAYQENTEFRNIIDGFRELINSKV